MFHNRNIDQYYRWDDTGDVPECMEVWPEETPWAAPESRGWYQLATLLMYMDSAADDL